MITSSISGYTSTSIQSEGILLEGNTGFPGVPLSNGLMTFNLASVTGLSTITNDSTIASNY